MVGGASVSAVLSGAAPACMHEKMGPEIDHAPLPPSSTANALIIIVINRRPGKAGFMQCGARQKGSKQGTLRTCPSPGGAAAKRTIGEGGEAPAASQGPIFDVVRSSGDWGTGFRPAGWQE